MQGIEQPLLAPASLKTSAFLSRHMVDGSVQLHGGNGTGVR